MITNKYFATSTNSNFLSPSSTPARYQYHYHQQCAKHVHSPFSTSSPPWTPLLPRSPSQCVQNSIEQPWQESKTLSHHLVHFKPLGISFPHLHSASHPSYEDCIALTSLSPTSPRLNASHNCILNTLSYASSSSINSTNTSLLFSILLSIICLTVNTWSMQLLLALNFFHNSHLSTLSKPSIRNLPSYVLADSLVLYLDGNDDYLSYLSFGASPNFITILNTFCIHFTKLIPLISLRQDKVCDYAMCDHEHYKYSNYIYNYMKVTFTCVHMYLTGIFLVFPAIVCSS